MKSKSRQRLGISTVIASMLMIVITVSLAGIVLVWAGTTYGLFTGKAQQAFAQNGQAMGESFTIENLFFLKSSSTLKVFVRNVGAQQINIAALYVNGTAYFPIQPNTGVLVVVSPCKVIQVNSVWVANMTVSSVCEFDLKIPSMDASCSPSPWCTGDVFNIVVATLRGNRVALAASVS